MQTTSTLAQTVLPSATTPRPDATDTLASAAPLPSSALLRGQKTVSIEHQGEIYRLQLTRLGKLILTK